MSKAASATRRSTRRNGRLREEGADESTASSVGLTGENSRSTLISMISLHPFRSFERWTLRSAASFAFAVATFVAGLSVGASPLAAIDESPYGLNIHAPQGADLARRLDKVQASGVKWVRIDFVWAWVEPAQDQFSWQIYDDLVAAARARGLWVFATLAYTPAWATDGRPLIGVPRRTEDWTDVCVRAAQRYGDSIEVWGLWNEPNLNHFWSGSRQQYMDVILRPGATAIRSANSNAKIAGPDLAHLTSNGSDWYVWLREILERAGDSIDIVTHHLYDRDGPRDVTDKLDRSTQFGSNPTLWPLFNPSVREVLTKAGWFGRPFWLTETGWVADSASSEAAQADHVSVFLRDWLSARPGREWIDKIFLYELADDPSSNVPKWGLLKADLSEKPAFRVVRNLALGIAPVAGIDEAGRGPWAGPVVAAAVILHTAQTCVPVVTLREAQPVSQDHGACR